LKLVISLLESEID